MASFPENPWWCRNGRGGPKAPHPVLASPALSRRSPRFLCHTGFAGVGDSGGPVAPGAAPHRQGVEEGIPWFRARSGAPSVPHTGPTWRRPVLKSRFSHAVGAPPLETSMAPQGLLAGVLSLALTGGLWDGKAAPQPYLCPFLPAALSSWPQPQPRCPLSSHFPLRPGHLLTSSSSGSASAEEGSHPVARAAASTSRP